MDERPRRRRGFAAMPPDRLERVARMGGWAVQRAGTAYRWTPEEAARVGRRGGQQTQARRRAQEPDR